MKTFVKIGGTEYKVLAACVRPAGSISMISAGDVIIHAKMTYTKAKKLFKEPGEWFVIERTAAEKYADGTVIPGVDNVTDCTAYEILSTITDKMDGTLEIVMRSATDTELLQVLTM